MKPESSGCNELRYNLDADTIAAIFKTYPAGKPYILLREVCFDQRCYIVHNRINQSKCYKMEDQTCLFIKLLLY